MVAALDTYFTVMAESGLSASGFTARIVASTRASLAAAVLGAWCAFTGPLHGGAPGPTLDMLDDAQAAPDLDAWLEAKLRAGERLMGFGHRVFRGNDPRAEAMRQALAAMGPMAGRLAFASHRRGARRRGHRTGQTWTDAAAECGDHGGTVARRGGVSAGGVHAGVRGGALRGVDRACAGAERRPAG